MLSKRGSMGQGVQSDARFQSRYMEWQPFARRFSRQVGAASFQAQITSDLGARCDIFISERNGAGEWEPTTDPALVGLIELYRNELQDPSELVRHHVWHYNVAGEMVQSQRDGVAAGIIDYQIHSTAAVEWDKPEPGLATVKLTPDGKVSAGTAFVVPRAQLTRFWVPDHEWPAYAWSPMAAGVDDLKRWRSLARYALHTADSALAMDGILWAPGEAFEGGELGDGADGVGDGGGGPGTPKNSLEDDYYALSKLKFSESDDVTAVAPAFWHWDQQLGEPKWVQIGRGLDEGGIAHRKEALEDFARSTTLPSTTIVGGGVGDANHWSEWLATDKMVESGVKPVMDRVCHLDLTRTFLWPRAAVDGYAPERLVNIRVDYDPSPITVKPDLSENAQKLGPLGILNFETILEANGFDSADMLTDPNQREWLLEVLSKGQAGAMPGGGAPPAASSATTRQGPPARPVAIAAAVGAPAGDEAAVDPTAAAVLRQLSRARQSVGTKLITEAQAAYESALRAGGLKVKTRARGRAPRGVASRAVSAVDAREPLAPILAAVGITELELVDTAFDTFRTRALAELGRYRQRVAAVLAQHGLQEVPSGIEPETIEAGVDYIVAGLTSMVRARLLAGDEAILAAAQDLRFLAPRAPRRRGGFIDEQLPGLPDPDELAGAAARLVRNALAVTEGRASMTMPTTPDGMPTTTFTIESPSLQERISADLGVSPNWTWVHGFYGEPATVFEPHEALDGFTTTDREHDPELANLEGWPDVDVYAPNDHPGCTCEWVPAV